MLPANENIQASERKRERLLRDDFLIQREIGHALRRSFGSISQEPLPSQIALLLLQVALTEMVRTIADEEQETRR